MERTRIFRICSRLAVVMTLLGLEAAPALADGEDRPCSTESIAGSWMFATEVGQQLFIPDQDGDITAIGTMNFDSEGNVSGVFDNAVAGLVAATDIPYTGSVTVHPDCRGTLTFVTGDGFMRTDSIAVLNQSEIWAMSRDPMNLWTYRVRRISGTAGPDVLAAKIDAILSRLGLWPAVFEDDD